MTYPVVEKFISINGEGPLAGMLSAFIRLKGCNLSCNYCDTSWANESNCPANNESAEQLLSWLRDNDISRVTLTGGEPLLTPGVASLISKLGDNNIAVEIETNGSVDLVPFLTSSIRPRFTMDYKCPDSGMESHMLFSNFSVLSTQDSVKFVVSSEKDLQKAKELTEKYNLDKKCNVFLSPVFGRIDPKDIVLFMQKNHWNEARLQLQLHKFIWPPSQRGV